MMNTPRVLHVVSSLDRGGIETSLLRLIEATPRDVAAMDICCKGPTVGVLEREANALGARVHHCPLRPTMVGFARSFRRLLIDGAYDVVHVHLNALSGVPVWAARRAGVPVVTTFHNVSLFRRKRWFAIPGAAPLWRGFARGSIRYALEHSDAVLYVSRSTQSLVEEIAGRTRPDARVQYLGTPAPCMRTPDERLASRTELSGSTDAPVVVHVGRFCEAKNHGGVLDVFENVLRRRPNAVLLLVGDGPLKEDVERDVVRRGLGRAVRFLGWRDDVGDVMQCADVMLFPSLYEGLPVAVLEAAAVGLPVVASDIPCIREIVEHGASGYLHDRRDARAMADSVDRVLSDATHAAALGEAARRRHASTFSIERSAEAMATIHRELATPASDARTCLEPAR